ncbi:putative DNA mismatch repair protein MutS [Candidatus Xenohaliotis californiensis]|uniref:DNA mismatch repair protein MutS n=1 Tax=Candidatus Xenohaliotis californiensis TaxID=84677 RepID=A0ABM9N811_9RICK|nr:putative DNA mismatch repair protein MutS [Candidatus Xenohaliotis californiensis]
MSKKIPPSQNDINFWLEVIKNVKPIKQNKKISIMPPKAMQDRHFASKPVQSFSMPPKTRDIPDKQISIAKITRKQYKNFLHMGIQKLDLHGCTLQEAFELLLYTIKTNYEQKNRSLLVITGKGDLHNKKKHESIKGNLSKWLLQTELKNYISYYSQAMKKDGGDGAFYIKIRKKT